jgi:large subunit ribosomal protein L15
MDLKTVCSKGIRYANRKRIARGPGSGLGKTAGRGHKGWGQRSGARRRPGYEGGQMPIYRRVPKRGFTNARFRTDYTVINVDLLNSFDDGATVDLAAIIEHGLASQVTPLFKVLGNGDITKKLVVRAQKFSKSAKQKIQSAGGTVVELDERGGVKPEAPPEPAPTESDKAARDKAARDKKGDGGKPAPAAKQPKAKGEGGAKTGDSKKGDAKKGDAKPEGGKPKKKPDAPEKPEGEAPGS